MPNPEHLYWPPFTHGRVVCEGCGAAVRACRCPKSCEVVGKVKTCKTCELKPCPFCGGSDVAVSKMWRTYVAQCSTCVATSGGYLTKDAAIAAWNRRTEVRDAE